MSLEGLMVHDVEVVRAGVTTDEYGMPSRDWATATRTATKAWVTQTQSREETTDRDTQLSDWLAYLPKFTVIAGGDRLEWESHTFEVDGPPSRAWTPRGEHHVEVRLTALVSG